MYQHHSWRKLATSYLLVGFAFLPAGAIYAAAGLAGWDHWGIAVGCLGLGLLASHLVWTRFALRKSEELQGTNTTGVLDEHAILVLPSNLSLDLTKPTALFDKLEGEPLTAAAAR